MERTLERKQVSVKTAASTFSPEELSITYVCEIDIGNQSCAGCMIRPDKSVVVKPVTFLNAREAWHARFDLLHLCVLRTA